MDFEQKSIRLKSIINEFKMKRRPFLKWTLTDIGWLEERPVRPEKLDKCMDAYSVRLKGLWKRIDCAEKI